MKQSSVYARSSCRTLTVSPISGLSKAFIPPHYWPGTWCHASSLTQNPVKWDKISGRAISCTTRNVGGEERRFEAQLSSEQERRSGQTGIGDNRPMHSGALISVVEALSG